jgi:uncharacterized membrane protein YdjX (TVP38/TMEM64 family)
MNESAGPQGHGTPGWRQNGRFVPLGLIVLASGLMLLTGLHKRLSLEGFLASREMIGHFVAERRLAAVALYLSAYILVTALSVPSAAALSLAGGALFGGFLAGVLTVLGASVGAVLLFAAARGPLAGLAQTRFSRPLWRIAEGFRKDEAAYLLSLRLMPVFPFWLVNLAAALLGVSPATFAWTTLIGIIPGTFAYTFAGAAIDSIAAGQAKTYAECIARGHEACQFAMSAAALLAPEVYLSLALFAVAALIPVVIRRVRPTHVPGARPASDRWEESD